MGNAASSVLLLRKFAVESYLAGELPLWNPYLGNRTPLAANMQSAIFYPLNLIYLLFPVENAMGYSVALHVGLAGVSMYVFGRALGLSGFGSFVAGLSYAFSGFLISRAGIPQHDQRVAVASSNAGCGGGRSALRGA